MIKNAYKLPSIDWVYVESIAKSAQPLWTVRRTWVKYNGSELKYIIVHVTSQAGYTLMVVKI